MEAEDIELKEKLLSLQAQVLESVSSNQHKALLKAIDGLLEGYY